MTVETVCARRTHRRLIGALAAVIASVMCFAATADRAEAGVYTSYQCYPAPPVSSYDAVFFTPHNGFNGPVQCPGEGLSIQNPVAISVGGTATWTFTAPPGTVIRGGSFWYRVMLGSPGSGFTGGVFYALDGGGSGAWGTPTGFGGIDAQIVAGTRIRTLTAALQCGGTCPQNGGVIVQFSKFNLEMLDEAAPSINGLGGSLFTDGPRAGKETLTINATDQGSGIHRATVTVNDGQLSPHLVNSCALLANGGATSFTPCPPAGFQTQIDTESSPWRDGANTVQVCVQDYATGGAPNSDCTTRTVNVDNSCQASGGAPASGLAAGIEKEGGDLVRTLETKSTRGATVRGTLVAGGAGVPGANVCLYEKADAPGEDRELSQIARTKNDGAFAVQVPAGPTRDLDLVYRSNNQVIRHNTLRLDSEVVPTLKIRSKTLRNGESARFKGRIPGPHQADRAVTLQARAGKKWRTFKQVRTDEKGKFKAKYPFRHTRGKVTYRFRALVKKQGGYPYAAGASKKRKVKVIG